MGGTLPFDNSGYLMLSANNLMVNVHLNFYYKNIIEPRNGSEENYYYLSLGNFH